MATDWRWDNSEKRPLKRIVCGLTLQSISKVVEIYESRGWKRISDIKEYGYGYGCLMKFERKSG